MATYYVDPDSATASNWTEFTAYELGDIVWPTDHTTAAAGFVYECTTAGNSGGGAEPTWVYTTPDTSTTSDNTVTWTCREPDSWAEALPGIQNAIDKIALAPGDIVYCRGTETPTAAIDCDGTTGGSSTVPRTRFIGCNSTTGAVDGTPFVLDFSTNTCSGLSFNGMGWVSIENFEIKSSLSTGSYNGIVAVTASSLGLAFINCSIHGWPDNGVELYSYGSNATFVRCLIYDNAGIGLRVSGSAIAACTIRDNAGDYGGDFGGGCTCYGCLFDGNSVFQARSIAFSTFVNCIFRGTGGAGNSGVNNSTSRGSLYVGCRFVNNTYGITGGKVSVLLGCYFGSNTSGTYYDDEYLDVDPDGAGSLSTFGGSDTDDGFVDSSSGDFNLDPDNATLYARKLDLQ